MTDHARMRMACAAAVLLILSLLLTGCDHEKAEHAEPVIAELGRARVFEPRLTSARFWAPCNSQPLGQRVLARPDCGPPYLSAPRVSLPPEACEKAMTDHGETLRLLITQPACIDAAVDWLDARAAKTREARVLSDLSAALYVRALNDDRPSDLLRAHDAAKRAVAADANLAAASFNLALTQEALGFATEARASWNRAAQQDQSRWAQEASERATTLDRAAARNAALQWPLTRRRLPETIAVGDRRALAAFIRPFPAATQKYIEEELLPAWATAVSQKRPEDAQRRLQEASVIASELAVLTGDSYMRQMIERIEKGTASERRQLLQGHTTYARARKLDREYKIPEAEAAYTDAARILRKAGSPLSVGAELGCAIQLSRRTTDKENARTQLAAVATTSQALGYLNVLGRARGNIANLLQVEGRYLEALSMYDEALAIYTSMNDEENLANVHMRKAGIFRVLGQEDAALREAFLARVHAPRVVEMPSRHLLAGEIAATALALDFPQTALDYQTAFIRDLEREADTLGTNAVRVNRAIALRARAAIRLHLAEHSNDVRNEVRKELDEAGAITAGQVEPKIRNALRARIAEADGEAALPSDPQRAITAFSEALALSGPVRYRTFQAILLARRAEAHRLAGNGAAAEADLTAAIEELNREESDLLNGRHRGQGEALWSGYFARFQETYFRLMALLITGKRKKEAFAYAEKSRAFEPLSLVLELPVAEETLRDIDPKSVRPESLATIQDALPPGTFMLEYQVGAEQTFIWILSHDSFEVRTLETGQKAVKEWIHTLQREAVTRDAAMFDSLLSEPYAKLLAEPLDVIARFPNGDRSDRRLVIIPDRYMHGLPFAALRSRGGRYLVEDFTISTAASATLYVHALRRDRKLAEAGGIPSALLVGNPAFDRTLEIAQRLRSLPYAEIEARNAGALYSPYAKVLVREQATVPAFLSLAKDSVIVHVAGHAIVNPNPPFGTLLLLAPAKGHNGLLYTGELLKKLELDRARLVVLAACSSAGGVPVGPEGLAPLVRPIVAAGVPGIVGSLWTIDDQQSQKVLGEFHRQYRQGHDAARALQLAQIRSLNDLRERKGAIPILAWAPFQVVGHAESPFPLQPPP
jgi:CHAT domain-containing protein